MASRKEKITEEAIKEEEYLEKIWKLTRNLYDDAKRQELAHTYAADYWGGSHLALGLAVTALSAVVSASIFAEYEALAILGGILSLILVVISAISTFLNPDQRTTSHHKAKTLYAGIADRARALYEVDSVIRKQDLEYLSQTYIQLLKEMDETRKNSPRVPTRHFDRIEREKKEKERKQKAAIDLRRARVNG